MAFVRGPGPDPRELEADRLPRDYEESDLARDRNPPRHRHQPGQRPASSPGPRPDRRFRAVAHPLEESETGVVGRQGPIGGRPPHRGARARDQRLPVRGRLPGDRHVPAPRRDDRAPRRAEPPFENGRGSDRVARGLRQSLFHDRGHQPQAGEEIARASFHHLDAPTGGGPQAGLFGGADHDDRPTPLRVRFDHLYAYRLGQPE